MKISEIESNLHPTINEAGLFSYGYKKPRKGSVADLASKKRKEQEKNYVPIDPKDQMVGTAKLTSTPDSKKALQFHTVKLENVNVEKYAKHFFELYGIDKPYQKFITNIKSLGKSKVLESNEHSAIQPFIKAISEVDTTSSIQPGDMFAVLSFEINFAWKEINALGFTEPKEVAEVKMHSDGTINYIKFTDGDRYPRANPATYNNKPILQSAYFDNKADAESALSYLMLKVPSTWDIDTSELEKQTTLEATYSYGGAVRPDFNIGDTVNHGGVLGNVTVINFSGSSVVVRNNEGKAYKVPASSLSLVQRRTPAAAGQTQRAPTVTASQQGTPIGQSITYNTTKGPVKFTKTNKGWEALVGTAKKLFTTGDQFYNTLEKIWQSQTRSA